MQFIKFLILIIFILFSHNVKADTKIVFIDIDYLMKNSNIGKTSLKKIENLNNKNINILKENENNFVAEIANDNSDGQVVLSGNNNDLVKLIPAALVTVVGSEPALGALPPPIVAFIITPPELVFI